MKVTSLLASDFDGCPCCRGTFRGGRKPVGNVCCYCAKPLPGVPAVDVYVVRRGVLPKAA